jgi:hypothetical protein
MSKTASLTVCVSPLHIDEASLNALDSDADRAGLDCSRGAGAHDVFRVTNDNEAMATFAASTPDMPLPVPHMYSA